MGISAKIKKALASLEEVRRDLNVIDENHAEAEAVKRTLEATQAELAETQARLETSTAEFAKADGEYSRWQELHAKEVAKATAALDALRAEHEELADKVKEARSEHDNILNGIASLAQRLKV